MRNLNSIISGDVCAEPLSQACEQSRHSLNPNYHDLSADSNSNNRDCETIINNPLLCRFLSHLNAEKATCPLDDHTYHTFILQPGVYAKTLKSLRESDSEVRGYVLDKLRHDLIGDKFLIIKMPSSIHDITTGQIGDLIKSQLAVIAETTSNEDTKKLIQNIEAGLASSVWLDDSNNKREPDQQFLVKGSYYPGVVIEFAYSQSFEKLRRKAYDFIVGSAGSVQLVIGLETGSRKSKSFKISAWRPEFYRSENNDAVRMKAITERDIIRGRDGTLKPGCLKFHLRDFDENLATKYPYAELTKEITLDYDVLAKCLIRAGQFVPRRSPRRDIIKAPYE